MKGSCSQCLCKHGKPRSKCVECPRRRHYHCEHGRQRYDCKACGGAGVCIHGKRKSTCKKCGGAGLCQHSQEKRTCNKCRRSGGLCPQELDNASVGKRKYNKRKAASGDAQSSPAKPVAVPILTAKRAKNKLGTANDAIISEHNQDLPEQKQTRGRGRPRKASVAPEQTVAEEVHMEKQEPGSRGRRPSKAPFVLAEVTVAEKQKAAGRGRPRKLSTSLPDPMQQHQQAEAEQQQGDQQHAGSRVKRRRRGE